MVLHILNDAQILTHGNTPPPRWQRVAGGRVGGVGWVAGGLGGWWLGGWGWLVGWLAGWLMVGWLMVGCLVNGYGWLN